MIVFKRCLFKLVGEKIMAYFPASAFSEHQDFNLFNLAVIDNNTSSNQFFFTNFL